MNDPNDEKLNELAAECHLAMANSDKPAEVMREYFTRVFDLGCQYGAQDVARSIPFDDGPRVVTGFE